MTFTQDEIKMFRNYCEAFIDEREGWWNDEDLTRHRKLLNQLNDYLNYPINNDDNVDEAYDRYQELQLTGSL